MKQNAKAIDAAVVQWLDFDAAPLMDFGGHVFQFGEGIKTVRIVRNDPVREQLEFAYQHLLSAKGATIYLCNDLWLELLEDIVPEWHRNNPNDHVDVKEIDYRGVPINHVPELLHGVVVAWEEPEYMGHVAGMDLSGKEWDDDPLLRETQKANPLLGDPQEQMRLMEEERVRLFNEEIRTPIDGRQMDLDEQLARNREKYRLSQQAKEHTVYVPLPDPPNQEKESDELSAETFLEQVGQEQEKGMPKQTREMFMEAYLEYLKEQQDNYEKEFHDPRSSTGSFYVVGPRSSTGPHGLISDHFSEEQGDSRDT